jgi:hypothetical protein|tara:strand:- start:946 stop:1674 length:729 start_codon:yes stop_codon:yes gene_type:complete
MLTLIIFSCEDISEKITNYSYLEYMEDGWEAFVYKEWDLGKEIFNIGLLQDSENYSEAYSGLGWIYLFEANTLPGQPNKSKRDSLRNLSAINFDLAYSEGLDENNSWSNILSGKAFLLNFKSDSLLAEYYNNIFIDNTLWDMMIENANDAISLTDQLLALNSNYNFYPYIPLDDFEYDLCINKNKIRILRSQLYFKLENYSNVYDELSLLTDSFVCPDGTPSNMQEAIYCISYVSNLLSDCN